LAWEPAAEDIDGTGNVAGEGGDVRVAGDTGPVPGEDALAELVLLAEPRRAETARALEAEIEASNPAEQGADSQGRIHFASGSNGV
jgi:hypothetical protein